MSREEFQKLMEEWPKHYDPAEVERKWQEAWLTKEFWEKVYSFRDGKEPTFVIDTPPPFTSGEIHVGHARWVAIIDAIARFRRIEGFNVLHPQGWDAQGLPTELKVQFKLGVPKENRELFLTKCREWTEEMISKMKSSMIRLGYRPEWERFEYRTYDPDYRRIVQLSLIQMYKMGLLEMRDGPIYWCPKCETSLSQSEVGYVEMEGQLHYIEFRVKEGGKLIIATTRPELLSAIQAVAVNPKDQRYVGLFGKLVEVPLFNKEVKVIADEAVDPSYGTGAVMICTFGDPQDIKWQLKYGLPITETVDEKGVMKNTGGLLDGLKVPEARKKVVRLLDEAGVLIKSERIKHNVLSHTERSDCGSPIEFLSRKQLFIKLLQFKNNLLEEAKKMKFKPQRMSHYLEEWIESLEWDWNISRQRIYGTPLPFWYCRNNHLYPAREEELPVDPAKQGNRGSCPVCGETLEPITDVADVWIDSSVTALYITGYYHDPNRFKITFPVSLRQQGTDIIRTWLFYTLFRTWALTGQVPFKEVLVNGQVLGPDGSRMSKSKGNVVSPMDRIDEFGADAIRMALLSASVGEDLPFKWEVVRGKKLFLQKLWNAARLVFPFLKDYRPSSPNNLSIVDRWILSVHRRFVEKVVEHYQNYDFHLVLEEAQSYFWEIIADEYLELIKSRLFKEDEGAKYVIWRVLKDIIVLLHPIAPHITEEIYSRLYDNQRSVILEGMPEVSDIPIDEEAERVGKNLMKATSEIRSAKIRNRIPIGQKVSARIYGPPDFLKDLEIIEEDLKLTLRLETLEKEVSGQIKAEILSDHGSSAHRSL